MTSSPINKSSPIKSILFTVFALVLAASLAMPARAQAPDLPVLPVTPAYHTTIGTQHALLLRSRNEAIRAIAMQNIIFLTSMRPGEFDLTPAVPALLNIFQYDRNRSGNNRIMAAATLHAIGDRSGMDQLNRLSQRGQAQSKHTRHFAQYAVSHHYTQAAMEHEMERAAHFTAKGNVKKAEKHTLAAAVHRSSLGLPKLGG